MRWRRIRKNKAGPAVGEDLRTFIDQFLEMAEKTRALAIEKDEPNFAEWFGELIEKAEALRGTVTR